MRVGGGKTCTEPAEHRTSMPISSHCRYPVSALSLTGRTGIILARLGGEVQWCLLFEGQVPYPAAWFKSM